MTATAAQKRSWPLLAFAALSFIPGFGFFLGAVAVTWGLLSNRPRAKLAIILGASGCLLSLAESAALMFVMYNNPEVATARVVMAQEDLRRIATALERHRSRTGSYPPDLKILTRPVSGNPLLNVVDHSASLFSVRPYQYQVLPDGSYRLFAVGADGLANSADDVQVPTDSLEDDTAVRRGNDTMRNREDR